jgi:hypothetical protein
MFIALAQCRRRLTGRSTRSLAIAIKETIDVVQVVQIPSAGAVRGR